MQAAPSPHMSAHHHTASRSALPSWQRWIGLSEVWVRGDLSSQLLVTLRWLAVLGQGLTLLVAACWGVAIAWWPCGLAVGSTLVSNAALSWWLRQTRSGLGGGFFHVALWDVLSMTLLLYWTGGLLNPFALFFLVQLTLAAVALRSTAAISLGLLTAGACVALHHQHVPLRMMDGQAVPIALISLGHVLAIILAGGFILSMLVAIRRRSHRLQMERERLRRELEGRERFLSVAALATGFAHELATPLGTIALAADELQSAPTSEVVELIAREAARCQSVLARLRELGQESLSGASEPCVVQTVIHAVMLDLPEAQRTRVHLALPVDVGRAQVACSGLKEALMVLLRNALLSSADTQPVQFSVSKTDTMMTFVVRDHGPGFSAEMLEHWGEPFRSTRESAGGMGLGLFFVRRLAASMQGSVEVRNVAEGGACVALTLPLHPSPPVSV